MPLDRNAGIFVAGHRGLVGGAVVRELARNGFTRVLTRSRAELDLMDAAAVRAFFAAEKPAYVVLAAARVGGIHANNTRPADFIYENLAIQNSVIYEAHRAEVRKLLFLGSSCIYPKLATQPMTEDSLLTGPLEPTNEWYAIAKIAGLKLCQAIRRQHGRDFISGMPTNLYGPGDNYDLQGSHVLPALIRKFHEAKSRGESSVVCWGTGSPSREFLYVDDLARACLFLMDNYSEEGWINIGYGSDVTIRELSELVGEVVGFRGTIQWDTSKPDGTPRKLMDSSRLLRLGWKPRVALREGIALAYTDFQNRFPA